jgi:protein-S-isoprenylcysteine O-methyltransferase Ste14
MTVTRVTRMPQIVRGERLKVVVVVVVVVLVVLVVVVVVLVVVVLVEVLVVVVLVLLLLVVVAVVRAGLSLVTSRIAVIVEKKKGTLTTTKGRYAISMASVTVVELRIDHRRGSGNTNESSQKGRVPSKRTDGPFI